MYSSSYYSSSATEAASGFSAFMSFLFVVIAIVVLVAWLVAINLFIEAAKKKGHYKNGGSGILWFVGIFATPIVVGIYVASLPDMEQRSNNTIENANRPDNPNLPSI